MEVMEKDVQFGPVVTHTDKKFQSYDAKKSNEEKNLSFFNPLFILLILTLWPLFNGVKLYHIISTVHRRHHTTIG